MRRITTLLASTLLFSAAVVALAGPKPEEVAIHRAQTAAGAWLPLVDEGQYEQSWDQAAKLFKGAVSREKWAEAAKGVRAPLGKLVSRKLASAKYAESIPGGPDGKYVVIEYDASFENKKSAVETVTPMLDPDGSWRVSGYFIK
jgi:hypothetical protein